MKKKVLLIILFIFLCIPIKVLASDKITLTNKIENISNPIKDTITYKIQSQADNPKNVENIPDDIVLSFEDVELEDNTLTNQIDIDFSNTIFQTPGTYRYGLTQKSSSDDNIILAKKRYEIYVNVTNENGILKTDVSPLVYDFEEEAKKELEYTNTMDYTNIVIESKVDGDYKNQDKDTYFKYKIIINGTIGSKYTITGQDEEVIYKNEKIETANEYIVKEDEDNYVYIYLKDNQKVIIGINELEFNEIPKKIDYSITEIDGSQWETTINDEKTKTKNFKTTDKNNILIINKRDFDNAVTGLFYKVGPFILLLVISIFAIILYIKHANKKHDIIK